MGAWSHHQSVKDAIDNITTKVDLLKYCHDHNIKVRVLHLLDGPR